MRQETPEFFTLKEVTLGIKSCCCFHWLDILCRPAITVRGSIKIFGGDLLFSRASCAKINAGSLGSCANLWLPSFIRNIPVKN